MDGDLGTWPEPYHTLYCSMGTRDNDMESGDNRDEYGMYYYPSPTTGLVGVTGFINPTMPTDFPHPNPFSDTSFIQNSACLSSGRVSIPQRQQANSQLHINTQLSSFPNNDSDSSVTSSSSSFPAALQTPFLYPGSHPSFHSSLPQLTSNEIGKLVSDLEKMPPFPMSPSSPFSPGFERDTLDDFSPPLHVDTDVVTQAQLPHILEWKRVIEQCGTNDFIPQVVYQPYTEADRKRYIRDVVLQDTIFFNSEDSAEPGISLDDALKQRLRHLKNKDDRMFVNCGPSVSIRIQWPGYASWSKQIPTMDFKTPKGHITRVKLAKNIATCVRRFADEVQNKAMEAESDRRWKIGERYIKVEDLILVSLHHVSKGSWQPQLRLRNSSLITSYP